MYYCRTIQGSLPVENSAIFKIFKRFCNKNNCNLIFDEMITGVRVNKFSVHEKYVFKPDITTVGKIIGGGLPIGVMVFPKVENKIKNNEIKSVFWRHFLRKFTFVMLETEH